MLTHLLDSMPDWLFDRLYTWAERELPGLWGWVLDLPEEEPDAQRAA